nr:MAG TPA: hypothetical protein [Caudoviricetes sp.]
MVVAPSGEATFSLLVRNKLLSPKVQNRGFL